MAGNNTRSKWVFNCANVLTRPLSKLLFGYEYETLPQIDGPVLVLSNHNTDSDCAFLALACRRPLCFVATENLIRMSFFGKIFVKLFDPILHYKGSHGVSTIKTVLKRIKDGKSVAMFPEGNRSFNGLTCPIPPATGKMAKASGATLVNYRLEGGYFSAPRWGKGIRKGRVRAVIAGIYPPDVLSKMSQDEVIEVINRDLYEDAYKRQSKEHIKFKGHNTAEGIESTLYICPKCGKMGTLRGKGDTVSCDCGYFARYTDEGYLEDSEGNLTTITMLDQRQRELTEKAVSENKGGRLFEDNVTFRIVDDRHRRVSEKSETLSAYADRLEFSGRVLPYDRIDSIAINQRNLLLIHEEGSADRLEFTGPAGFSALKYLYAFRSVIKSPNGIL